jgi:hypothetical protein
MLREYARTRWPKVEKGVVESSMCEVPYASTMQKHGSAGRRQLNLRRKCAMIMFQPYSGIWDWICKALGVCN